MGLDQWEKWTRWNGADERTTEIFFQNANKIFRENFIQNCSIEANNKPSTFLAHTLTLPTFHPIKYSLANVKHSRCWNTNTYHCLPCPVKLSIFYVASSFKEIMEQFSEVLIVRSLKEIQSSHITQVRSHFLCNLFLNFNGNDIQALENLNPLFRMPTKPTEQNDSWEGNCQSASLWKSHYCQKEKNQPPIPVLGEIRHTLHDYFYVFFLCYTCTADCAKATGSINKTVFNTMFYKKTLWPTWFSAQSDYHHL